jgi:glycosyltransferase involved in cell wall biosynthesis
VNVAFTSHDGRLGGAERSLLELAAELAGHGARPSVVCPPQGGLAHAARACGLDVLPLEVPALRPRSEPGSLFRNGRIVAAATRRLHALLRRGSFDLVHANTTVAQLWSGPAARLCGLRSAWHWRDFYDMRWLNRALSSTADVVVACSDSVAAFAERQLGTRERLYTVRNGVHDRWREDVSSESRALRERWGAAESDVVVLLAAQAVPRKGHAVLVRGLASLAERSRPRAVLMFPSGHGASEYASSIRELVKACGCSRDVVFAGESDDLTHALSAADVVVVPSREEPFGRIAVEAMLARRAVVASRVDELEHIVVDGRTGRLVPVDDPHSLGAALADLASDRATRVAMGRAGRERALARYSIEGAARALLGVYRELGLA